jgi:RNA polymerase sigma-70 factor, ECF subfamily
MRRDVDSSAGRTEIEALYREHGTSLVLFAAAFTGDRARGQDAVHQVFLKLLDRGSLTRAKDVKAYLFASVRNALLNERKVRERNVALEPDAAWFEPPDRDYAAEQKLRRELLSLSDDLREVTVMHVWGELTFAQISEVLGISANTVASRYRYALAALRKAMCAEEDSCAKP